MCTELESTEVVQHISHDKKSTDYSQSHKDDRSVCNCDVHLNLQSSSNNMNQVFYFTE